MHWAATFAGNWPCRPCKPADQLRPASQIPRLKCRYCQNWEAGYLADRYISLQCLIVLISGMRGKIPFMVNGLVTATELGLLALVGILAIRMVALSRGEALQLAGGIAEPEISGPVARRTARTGKQVKIASAHGTELRTQLHILAGLQERDCRSEEHTSELQSRPHLVCRLLLEKKKT